MVVVGGSYGGVELACNLATELGAAAGDGKVEVTLAAGSEVSGRDTRCCCARPRPLTMRDGVVRYATRT